MPDTAPSRVLITPLPGAVRLSVRCGHAHLPEMESRLSAAFPQAIRQVAGTPQRFVSCLGPDEWVFSAPTTEFPDVRRKIRQLTESTPCSVTDISSRELSYRLDGPAAAALLNSGCPANLRDMPAPSAARTVFEGVQVSLVKWSEDAFRLDVWRSFAPHVLAGLHLARRDVHSDQ